MRQKNAAGERPELWGQEVKALLFLLFHLPILAFLFFSFLSMSQQVNVNGRASFEVTVLLVVSV